MWLHIHPVGLTRVKFLQLPLTYSRAQGKEGRGGKSLREQPMVTSFKTHQTLGAQEPRCRRSKGWSSKLGCTGSAQTGTAILLQEQLQALPERSSGDTQTQLQPGTSRGRALELASAPEVTTGEVSKAQQAAPPTPLGIPEGLIASLVYLGKNSP